MIDVDAPVRFDLSDHNYNVPLISEAQNSQGQYRFAFYIARTLLGLKTGMVRRRLLAERRAGFTMMQYYGIDRMFPAVDNVRIIIPEHLWQFISPSL